MKKILILLLLLFVKQVNAQIPTTNFTVNGQTFLVKNLSNTLVLTNNQSPIKSGQVVINGIPNDECYDKLLKGDFYNFHYKKQDFLRLYNILREVFPSRRALQIGLYETITFRFSMSPQGQVLDIEYQFNKVLPFTTQEIALLDKKLRENMFFTLKPNNICNNCTVINYDWFIRFEDLQSPYGNGYGEDWDGYDKDLQDLIDMGADPRN